MIPHPIEEAVRTLIAWAGDDPEREGLLDTPGRVVNAYREFFNGYEECPIEVLSRTFDDVGGYDEEFTYWGGEDNDMHWRALDAGLEEFYIHDRTTMLHQWHTYEYDSYPSNQRQECDNQVQLNRNRLHRMRGTVARNQGSNWGQVHKS